MSSYMMTSLIESYEQSFHVFHEQTKHLNGSDQFYKGVHSSSGENSLFKDRNTLESDAITTSVPVWIPTDNSVVTPVISDYSESDSPGSSYVPGSPLPSPGPDSDTYGENDIYLMYLSQGDCRPYLNMSILLAHYSLPSGPGSRKEPTRSWSLNGPCSVRSVQTAGTDQVGVPGRFSDILLL